MVLSTPISNNSLKSDSRISIFNDDIHQNPPGDELLQESKFAFQRFLLFELFDFLPLSRRMGYCTKLMFEHQESVDAVLKDNIQKMNISVRNELLDVSEKFKGQLHQLIAGNKNIEQHEPLQERIRKASIYFSEKLSLIVAEQILKFDLEIDNKTVRKSVNDAVTKLSEDTHLKLACLNGCRTGFTVKGYMEIRAKSAIEPSGTKPKFKSSSLASDGLMPHPDLYKALKTWRGHKADELNVDTYMILPQKTLLELITHLPSSLSELKRVKGLGNKKITQFGKEILPIIIEYRIQNKIELSDRQLDNEPEEEPKIPKVDTKLVSFESYQGGKTIAQIAYERSLTISTIEGHLAYFIGTGELGIDKLVSKEKIALISDWFLKNNTVNLGSAKAGLGDLVNYAELKCVLNYLVFTKQISG